MIRVAEMFSGIGGFRYGLEEANQGSRQLGNRSRGTECSRPERNSTNSKGDARQGDEDYYQCVWANELDKYACQIYRKNFTPDIKEEKERTREEDEEGLRGRKNRPNNEGDKKLGGSKSRLCEQPNRSSIRQSVGGWHEPSRLYEGDIRAVDASTIPDHDLLCAGFPCQSFSIAGKRRGFEDTRGTLFFEICRVIQAKRPGYLWLENVKGLLSHDNGDTFQTIIGTLDELGYDCQWQVLNSKDFGVPQNRERVFIIGHTRGKPRPKVFPIGENDKGIIDTLEEEQGREERIRGDFASVDSRTGSTARGQHFIAGSLTGGGHSGGLHSDMTILPVLTPDREKKRQHGRRFKENGEPMFTLTGQDIHGIQIANAVDVDGYLRTGARPRDKNGKPQLLPIGYRRIRRLTPIECERLQGFPDNWTEGISDTQRYKSLGNAVTTNVITAIGNQFLEWLVEGDIEL